MEFKYLSCNFNSWFNSFLVLVVFGSTGCPMDEGVLVVHFLEENFINILLFNSDKSADVLHRAASITILCISIIIVWLCFQIQPPALLVYSSPFNFGIFQDIHIPWNKHVVLSHHCHFIFALMISFYIDKNLSWRNLHRTWSSLVAHGAVEIRKIED